MVAVTGKMFHKYDNEAIVKRLFTNRPRNDWNGGYMKTIISVILTVVSASVLADQGKHHRKSNDGVMPKIDWCCLRRMAKR